MTKNLLSKFDKTDLIVILSSLLLFAIVASLPIKTKPYGDLDFHIEAKSIANYLWGIENFDKLSITKAPGPTLFYIIPYFIAGPDASDNRLWYAGVAWTAIFITLATLLIRWSTINLSGKLAGNISIVLLFIIPLHIYYSLGISAEALSFIGCSFFIYGYSKLTKTNKIDNISEFTIILLITTGITLMVLARPNAGLVIPIIFLYLFWNKYIKSHNLTKKFRLIIMKSTIFAGFVLTLAMIGVKSLPNNRNTLKQEAYLSYVMTIGRYQFRTETWDWRFWDPLTRPNSKDYIDWEGKYEALAKIGNDSNNSLEKVLYQWVFNDIINNPVTSLKQFFVRIIFGHTLQISSLAKNDYSIGPLKGPFVYWFVHIILNIINCCLLCFSILLLIKKKEYCLSSFGLMITPWIALIIFHGIVYMEQRYLFPARPIMIILASLFLIDLKPGILSFLKKGKILKMHRRQIA
jgi:hypothetical protein